MSSITTADIQLRVERYAMQDTTPVRVISITVFGAPRTKKNSPQIVPALGRSVLIPSEAYKEWFREAMKQAAIIRSQLAAAGLELPVTGPVNVRALFYRDRNIGDTCGYYQALGDWLQAPRVSKRGKRIRNGAGIIEDDRQIASWDGSRLRKDAENPRIEIEISASTEDQ
jgi:hypothetical protein